MDDSKARQVVSYKPSPSFCFMCFVPFLPGCVGGCSKPHLLIVVLRITCCKCVSLNHSTFPPQAVPEKGHNLKPSQLYYRAIPAEGLKLSGLWHAAALASTIICLCCVRCLIPPLKSLTHTKSTPFSRQPIALGLGELATSVHRTQCMHVGSPCQRQCVHASRNQKTSFLS